MTINLERPHSVDTLERHTQKICDYMLLLRRVQDQAGAAFLSTLGNLNMQQLNVLNMLGDHQSATMGEIATASSLSLSSVTVIIDKLVKMKLVKRIRNEEDRRVVRGALTTEGLQIYQIQIKHMQEVIRKMLTMLSEEEQASFVNVFSKLTGAFM